MSMQRTLKTIGAGLLGLSLILFFISSTSLVMQSITVVVENLPAHPTVTQWLCCPDPLYSTNPIRIEWWASSQETIDKVEYKLDQGLWVTITPPNTGDFDFTPDASGIAGNGHYVFKRNVPQYQDFGPGSHTVYVNLYHGATKYPFSNTFTPTPTGTWVLNGIWVEPTDGATVSGTINIWVKAGQITDFPTSVELMVDTKVVSTLTYIEYPSWGSGSRYGWQTTWDTRTVSNGAHQLQVDFWKGSQLYTMSILAYFTNQTQEFWVNPLSTIERTIILSFSICSFIVGFVFLIIPTPTVTRLGKHF